MDPGDMPWFDDAFMGCERLAIANRFCMDSGCSSPGWFTPPPTVDESVCEPLIPAVWCEF